MIDLSKCKIIDKILIEKVWNNNLLEYVGKSERLYIDEIKEKEIRKYKNLIFTKFQDRLEISGSLHYFFNDDLHNADDFYIEDCIKTIDQIKNLFDLDLTKCFLINLEYGVNINPQINVTDLVHNLMYHNKKQFSRNSIYNDYKTAGNDGYKQVKAYNKSVQFPHLCENIFRFEIRTQQAKFINSLGLYTMNDLIEFKNYDVLINSLLKEWDNVLLFDLSKDIDIKFFNTYFWEEAIMAKNRNRFCLQKALYQKKLGANNLHSNIREIIDRKTKYLKCVHIPTITKMETAQVKIHFID